MKHQVGARVESETFHRLDAIRQQTMRSSEEILAAALRLYLEAVDPELRRSIEAAAAVAQRHCATCRPRRP